jgi:hypothetical protein
MPLTPVINVCTPSGQAIFDVPITSALKLNGFIHDKTFKRTATMLLNILIDQPVEWAVPAPIEPTRVMAASLNLDGILNDILAADNNNVP